MDSDIASSCYKAWRRSEGYAVPVNADGIRQAEERYKEFSKGYYAGVRASANLLEKEHSKNKHIHKFYLIAKSMVEKLLIVGRE